MTDRFTDLDDPGWERLFTGLSESWFRLETLQRYDVDYEDQEFREFLESGTIDPAPGPWQQMITGHTAAGRSLRRVHVVVEPLSDYLRYEFAAYHRNAEAGEDIGIIAVSGDEWPVGLPSNRDFWLFDDADAWDMLYDDAGHFVAAERITNADELEQCRQWRDRAIALATPLSEYTRHAA